MRDAPPDDLRSLAGSVDGRLKVPGDEGFDAARSVWNGAIDREPAAILRCTQQSDVVTAVDVAREGGHRLSVKSGGHHVSGRAVCDGGLMLDLSALNDVTVDRSAGTVRVEPGATWGDVDEACLPHGLVVPGSQDPSVGVAGLTLGGGVGWLSPTFGLTSDNLRTVELVTATGDVVEASAATNADLFWAIRGGGGNFGIVTSFEFRAHEFESTVLAGSLIYHPEALSEVLPRYESFMAEAPPEVRPLLGLMELPEASYYPSAVHNERVLLLILFYGGEPAAGEAALEPLRSIGDPLMDSVRPREYFDWQQVGEAAAVKRSYVRSQYLETFPPAAIETISHHGTVAPCAESTVFISPRHGAEVDPTVDATAYPHRSPAHHLLIESRWEDAFRDEATVGWVRRFHEAIEPYSTGAAAVNFLTADEIPDRVPAAFGDNYARLRRVKREWDPHNRFRTNPNIEPAATDRS